MDSRVASLEKNDSWIVDRQFQPHLKLSTKTKMTTSLLYHIEHFRWMLVPTFKHIPKRRTLTEMAFLLLLFFHSYHRFYIIVFLCE